MIPLLSRKLLLITGTCFLAINAAQAQYKYGDGSGIGGYVDDKAVGGAGGGYRTPGGEGGGAMGVLPVAPISPNVGGVGAPGSGVTGADGGLGPSIITSQDQPLDNGTHTGKNGSDGRDSGGGGGGVVAIVNADYYEQTGTVLGGFGGKTGLQDFSKQPRGSGGGGVALILNGRHFIVRGAVVGGTSQVEGKELIEESDFGGGGALAVILNSGILDVYGSVEGGDGGIRDPLDNSTTKTRQGSAGGGVFMVSDTTLNIMQGARVSTGAFTYIGEKTGPAVIISGNNSQIHNQGLLFRAKTATIDGADSVVAPAVYVFGDNNKIINEGNITGNNTIHSANSDSNSYAIEFEGNNNTLELRAGQIMNGVVKVESGTNNHLVLGGSTDDKFNFNFLEKIDPGGSGESRQIGYLGFADFIKDGTSTWTGSGMSAAVGPWKIEDGTLTLVGDADLSSHSSMSINTNLDISGIDSQTTLQNMSGGTASAVHLGSKTLTLTNDLTNTFAGVASGVDGNININSGSMIFTGDNTYSGLTKIASGASLQVGDGTTNGMIASDVDVMGDFTFKRSDDITFSKVISGSGTLNHNGAGLLTLTGENTHIGLFNIVDGNVQVGDNASNGIIQSNVDIAANKILSFNRSDQITYHGVINGAGQFVQAGTGTLVLSGSSDGFTGNTLISQGTLDVQSTLGGTVKVNTDTNLTGTGIIKGDTDIIGGNLIGMSGRVLTFENNLHLDENSNVNVALGAPSNFNLFNVNGNITLAGKLNITDLGSFGPGIYRIFDYGGALTNNNFEIGTSPINSQTIMAIQTSIPNQVNLVANSSADDPTVSFWDGDASSHINNGIIDGGDGTWNETNQNWTNIDGTLQNIWNNDKFAIFTGNAGVVTIADAPIIASGLQFSTTGYKLTGAALQLEHDDVPIVRVDENVTAIIESELKGNQGLNKTDFGTLILSGDNTYTGDTIVSQGVLQLGAGGNSGSIAGDIKIQKTDHGTGSLFIDRSDDYQLSNQISGEGAVTHIGSGTTTFTANNEFTGGLFIKKGTVKAGFANNSFGLGNLSVNKDAVADLNGFDITITGLSDDDNGGGSVLLGSNNLTLNQNSNKNFSGVISGNGGLIKNGNGELFLSGNNTYYGNTTINAGFITQNALNSLSKNSKYTISSGAELKLNSYNTEIKGLINNGSVNFGDSADTNLHVTGNYEGSNGKLYMRTVLGNDNSKTDKLVIDGDTTGQTLLYVKNLMGTGNTTNEGIKIVEVEGQSSGVFNLQGDFVTKSGEHAVVAGAYAYTLHQNGITNPADGNWYLRSERKDGPGPIVNPGTPVYQSATQTMKTLTNLPTLKQRVGTRYFSNKLNLESNDLNASKLAVEPMIWGRIAAAHDNFKGRRSLAHTNQKIDTVILQAGVDGQLYETENGKWITGITGQYGQATGNVTSDHGDGKIKTKSWGLGAILTWYGDDGLYLDGQGQITWLQSDLLSNTVNKNLAHDLSNTGYALSIEGGKHISINEKWSFTPQAQLIWSSISNSNFNDIWGSSVRSHSSDSMNLRAGVSLNYHQNWRDENNMMRQNEFYVVANLQQELLKASKINISGKSFNIADDNTWAEISLGGTYHWENGKYAIYGEGGFGTSLNNFAKSYTSNMTVGLKLRW